MNLGVKSHVGEQLDPSDKLFKRYTGKILVSFRDEFLRLLREDESFRFAVLGLLGIVDVQSSLRQLMGAVGDLVKVVQGLADGQGRLLNITGQLLENQNKLWENQVKLWEEVKALRADVNKLWEENNKIWLEIKALREDQNRLWESIKAMQEQVKALQEGQNKLWEELKAIRESEERHEDELKALREGQNKLWEEVKALREGQNRLWEEVRRLADGQNKLWEEVKALRTDVNKLWEENNRLWQEVRGLKINVNRLSKSVDSLSRGYGGLSDTVGYLVEQNVRHYLPSWVRDELGINIIKLRRRVVEGVGEFDGYAEVNNKIIVTEVKTTLRLRDVEEFTNKVNKLRSTVANREIIPIIAFVKKAKDYNKAIEFAKNNRIRIVRHLGEEDFEEIT